MRPSTWRRRAAIAAAIAGFAALSAVAGAAPLLRYYPEKAQKANVEGVAVISCSVTAEGKLEACTVVSEDPPGWGFGEKALEMAPLFKMRTVNKDGTPVTSPVTIPVTFRLPR